MVIGLLIASCGQAGAELTVMLMPMESSGDQARPRWEASEKDLRYGWVTWIHTWFQTQTVQFP